MASGIIEANRTGGTVKRTHFGCARRPDRRRTRRRHRWSSRRGDTRRHEVCVRLTPAWATSRYA
ncbi:hypothetical protein Ssi02_05120 [Sinosporangium siamense]|uniref:Uncharacterized protein n=1 Tax=Sinosporangium siamense TaxID=1367973 RepID=A0A919RE93_9ACTN|nr:hypothetical protein Ssi02_05120 [Sinosporangium siamense]